MVILVTSGLGNTAKQVRLRAVKQSLCVFVVIASCMGWTVAHEVGHVFGANYDWFEQWSWSGFIPPPWKMRMQGTGSFRLRPGTRPS